LQVFLVAPNYLKNNLKMALQRKKKKKKKKIGKKKKKKPVSVHQLNFAPNLLYQIKLIVGIYLQLYLLEHLWLLFI